MANVDLEKLSLEELKKLQKDADEALASFEKRKRAEAKAELESVAQKYGFRLSDFLPGQKSSKISSAPKYRHPDNASLTWTGRGRQPNWVKEGLEAGKSLADFAI